MKEKRLTGGAERKKKKILFATIKTKTVLQRMQDRISDYVRAFRNI